jgi:hypothetical protein
MFVSNTLLNDIDSQKRRRAASSSRNFAIRVWPLLTVGVLVPFLTTDFLVCAVAQNTNTRLTVIASDFLFITLLFPYQATL